MIVPPTGVRVLVATKPVDFRRGVDGLAAYVQEALKTNPFSGVIYVFRAKRADRVKLLFWDQTGLCLMMNDLHSYYSSFIFSGQFCLACILRACGGAIDEPVPSAALLLRQVCIGDFV